MHEAAQINNFTLLPPIGNKYSLEYFDPEMQTKMLESIARQATSVSILFADLFVKYAGQINLWQNFDIDYKQVGMDGQILQLASFSIGYDPNSQFHNSYSCRINIISIDEYNRTTGNFAVCDTIANYSRSRNDKPKYRFDFKPPCSVSNIQVRTTVKYEPEI